MAQFKVIAFYTAKNDKAHISFVNEANKWFKERSESNNFIYVSTDDWEKLNTDFLKDYQVIIFLDTRPEKLNKELIFRNTWTMVGPVWAFIFLHLL